ncbi:hypothetical protein NDU88_011184 [Pleurodeles waltl]|uniref:Uncharacterized protein n=1 Tax=Pleurodeles waltl TaxID=8319 RepID=A0AAV7R2N1_PLEWA|nr:hypothetical protein NDU88_011184 [Pleurodeles waltl]
MAGRLELHGSRALLSEKSNGFLTNPEKTRSTRHLSTLGTSYDRVKYSNGGGPEVLRDSRDHGSFPYSRKDPSIDDLEESLRELKVQVNSLASSLNFDFEDSRDYGTTMNDVSGMQVVSERLNESVPNSVADANWFLSPKRLQKSLGNYAALKSLGLPMFSRSSPDRVAGQIGSEISSRNYLSSSVRPVDIANTASFPVKLGAPHVVGVKSLLPPKVPVRSRSPGKTMASLIRGRSQSLDRSGSNRSRSYSPTSKRTRWLRSRSQSPKPVWRPNSAKANACSQPPPQFGRQRPGTKTTAMNRQSRSRSYKPGALVTRSFTPPRMKSRRELSYSWSPYGLASSAIPAPTAQEISKRFLESLTEGEIGQSLMKMSPYQQELARLRLERLRVEEVLLLELKRQQELERTRGPKPKWYEMKGSQFHYEARKNNDLLRGSSDFQSLYDYRQELAAGSREFQQLVQPSEMDSL